MHHIFHPCKFVAYLHFEPLRYLHFQRPPAKHCTTRGVAYTNVTKKFKFAAWGKATGKAVLLWIFEYIEVWGLHPTGWALLLIVYRQQK